MPRVLPQDDGNGGVAASWLQPNPGKNGVDGGLFNASGIIPVSKWTDNLILRRKTEPKRRWPFQKAVPAKNRWNVGPGAAVGIGCGAGLGAGVMAGAGFAPEPWKLFRFVVGLGSGCGIGIGYGFGFGLGVRWDQQPSPPKPERLILEL